MSSAKQSAEIAIRGHRLYTDCAAASITAPTAISASRLDNRAPAALANTAQAFGQEDDINVLTVASLEP